MFVSKDKKDLLSVSRWLDFVLTLAPKYWTANDHSLKVKDII